MVRSLARESHAIFIPFIDSSLRALRAFEGDPRLEKARELQRQLTKLNGEEEALFADRKKTNVAYIERFLEENSAPSALNAKSLRLLSSAESVDKKTLDEKLKKLSALRAKFPILLHDTGDESYKRYQGSTFSNIRLDLDAW